MQMNETITMLIPTKNRSAFLARALRYYAANNYSHLIFIGDSSDSGHVENIKKTINELRGKLNIKYKWYPQELNFTKCFNQMLKEVTTPYTSLIGDDDFLVPRSLEKCVRFLDSNQEYIGAHGVGATLFVERSGACFKVRLISDSMLSSREEETASKRLLNHLGKISNVLFCVYRTRILQNMFEHIEVPDHSFAGDLLPGCLAVVEGKIKELDCFHIAHLAHKEQNKAFNDIFDWLTSPNWRPSYLMFKQILSSKLSEKDAITPDEANFIVKKAFWSYLLYKLKNQFKGQYPVLSMRGRIRNRFPVLKKILDKARELKYKAFSSNKIETYAILSPRSPYYNDFIPIYRAVIECTDRPSTTNQ